MAIRAISPYESATGERAKGEELMRSMMIAIGVAALVAGAFAQPAAAKKSKMGCEVGKEYWDAAAGKCTPGKKPTKKKEG
jgi:hypothetical protein